MEEERNIKLRFKSKLLWLRWVAYILIPMATLFIIADNIETSISRNGLFDEYGQDNLCLCAFITLIIIATVLWIFETCFRVKERGRHRRRMECSDLCGLSLFFSVLLSVVAPFALLFGGVTGLMPFLLVFAFFAFIFLFAAIELSLYQFIPDSGWETVGYVAAALFVPPVAVAVISTVLWLLGKLMAF